MVFYDGKGKFTKIRNELLNRPEDIRLKKLAREIINMAQSGQYNYYRCIEHKEYASAAIALSEFAKHTAQAIYLLNKAYAPYYKWLFKGLERLDKLSEIKSDLEELLSEPYNVNKNRIIIESICGKVASEIRQQGLSERTDDYLEPYAYCINDKIKDGNIRTLSVI